MTPLLIINLRQFTCSPTANQSSGYDTEANQKAQSRHHYTKCRVLILTFTFMTNNNEIFLMSNNKIFNTCVKDNSSYFGHLKDHISVGTQSHAG